MPEVSHNLTGFVVLGSPALSSGVSIFPQLRTAFSLELQVVPGMGPTMPVC